MTSFHHQPEAQHQKYSAIHKPQADYPIFAAPGLLGETLKDEKVQFNEDENRIATSAFGGTADIAPSIAGLDSVESDPHVWSGRALQENFVGLAVSGLASMYPASDWSVSCSWPSWISARVRSH